MAAVQKGVGVVWSVGEITCTGAVIAAADMPQSVDYAHQAEKQELVDSNGEAAGLVYYNPTRTVTISVVPSSTTQALALASQDAMLIAPGTLVTITADPNSTVLKGANSGKYILESCRLRRTNQAASVVEMDLINYATDLSATIS